jgi:hypothetical protein
MWVSSLGRREVFHVLVQYLRWIAERVQVRRPDRGVVALVAAALRATTRLVAAQKNT